ncbi:MAG: lytic transglycosylase domain-containing protein [Pseudopelagicola sp.]|nr:lytic transglycosylase domain-containing protein [Pseudopelagicola sp.]
MKPRYMFVCALLLAVFVFWGAPKPGIAQSPPPFKDFDAKRVKAPQRGAKPKIDVQIGQTVDDPPKVAPVSAPKNPGIARYAWFWDQVSPLLSDKEPGRLGQTLDFLSQPPVGKGVDVMRLQDLQDIATSYQVDILLATIGTKVSPALVLAVIAVESSGERDALSAVGAQGLMQLMPDTVTRFGVVDPFEAADNIRGGVAFLDFLMESFDSDPVLVLAGYNAGETAVRNADGVPNYPETRDYVPKVLATYAVARGLCRTPPELISDGCVFVTR